VPAARSTANKRSEIGQMPGQPSPPAKGDWPASKQAVVIGACILSLVVFVIGAILGAGSSSSAVPLAESTVTVAATATKTVKVKVTKKPKPAPTTTVTVTARPKSRSVGKETQSPLAIAPPATLYALPPRRTMTVVVARATDPSTPDRSESRVATPPTSTGTVTEKHASGRDQMHILVGRWPGQDIGEEL
jgi:hypothetical protein